MILRMAITGMETNNSNHATQFTAGEYSEQDSQRVQFQFVSQNSGEQK
jgi:hypothetical protein